jgi:hypothetical protein
MAVQVLELDHQYVLNHCTKYLARENVDARHNFGQFDAQDPRSRICESWRFPLVDSYSDGIDFVKSYAANLVTFVYRQASEIPPQNIAVIGTFATLYQPIPLQPVKFLDETTLYHAVSVVVPKGEIHTYKFVVDGDAIVDPINPQRVVLDNNQQWSRFFTQLCTQPLSFEDWEFVILERLVDHILPFRTEEGENFLNRYYQFLDRQAKEVQYVYAYRLDQSVGAINFIDNILAREENHHLIDYKICLGQLDRILRQRNPFTEPAEMSKELYIDLYNEMATNQVNGWNYDQYGSPLYFLQLLRRHTYTGAFSHPKYGGNVGASGWAYLSERYQAEGQTLFDWRRAIEQPLGVNADYRG